MQNIFCVVAFVTALFSIFNTFDKYQQNFLLFWPKLLNDFVPDISTSFDSLQQLKGQVPL
jgi:hypothetical protein